MDEATARKIIENYLAGQSSEADFDSALDYLRTSSQPNPSLAALFRDLDLLGGLTHDDAQEIMPYYLEPLARAQLAPLERRRFLAHLSQCPGCAEIYLELRGFEAEVSLDRQKAPQASRPWPLLQSFLQSLVESAGLLRYSITFSPLKATGVREGREKYVAAGPAAIDEYAVLFEDTLDTDSGTYIAVTVTAWRTGSGKCNLQVELIDRLEQGHQAGQTIQLNYNGQFFSSQTDSQGDTLFSGLDIAGLTGLKLEIEIKL